MTRRAVHTVRSMWVALLLIGAAASGFSFVAGSAVRQAVAEPGLCRPLQSAVMP